MSTTSQTGLVSNASIPSFLPPSFSTTPAATSPSVDGSTAQSPSASAPTTQLISGEPSSLNANSPTNNADVDPQIIEALKGKDRIYVLKLGECMESLIHERRPQLSLQPTTSYQRLLVHRCSAYYRLAPDSDPVSKLITIHPTPESRIPTRRLCELVPAESTTQPAFKIMRRTDRKPKALSQAGSVTGEDADLSDVEPSESGSLGGRSAASSVKKRMTIEEREAAYAEARSRIFMDFDEKGREKDKDLSASSSSLSLASGSSTNGGSSSVGDADEIGSSPATESEWSGPSVSREKKDGKRSMATMSATSSVRSLRSNAPTFHGNGSNSSRNSRAGSPSHAYGTLYEHHPPPFEPSIQQPQHPMPPPQGYHHPYVYPYPPPNQPMGPYMQPYGYYPPYGPYPPPPQPPSDNNMHPGEMYPPLPMNYGVPYGWPHPHPPPGQQPMQAMHPPPPPHPQPLNHTATGPPPPPPNQIPQYPPYIPPSYNPPVTGYYAPPPPQHLHPHPPPPPQPQLYDPSASGNHVSPIMSSRPGPNTGVPSNAVHPSTRNTMPMNNNNPKGRGGGPPVAPQPRSSWSYGPGIGGGQNYNPANNNTLNGDVVGPRLTMRRGPHTNPSLTSRPHVDDGFSTASSSAAAPSSRRPYSSANSSQHPSLPPRPDWAVGLKPQPTHHQPHHRHQDPRNVSPSSIPRNLNSIRPQQTHNPPATALQSTDFPPLTSGPLERRTPATGAWGNPPNRSLFMSGASGGAGQPAPATNPAALQSRLEDADQGFERPPPKSSELFNPKVVRRPGGNGAISKQASNEKDKETGDAATAILVGQVASMTIENQGNSVPSTAVPSRESAVLTMAS